MNVSTSAATDEITMAIGRAVSCLLASGKHLERSGILEELRKSEKYAVDETKQVYATAIRLVTNTVSVRTG
ncbi:hypothetical protein SB719_16630 [Pantoea sp. SIMBA_079]|uniref:hypothetical protein n=1 Tax=Pantoea sp. SIMBA_079 TaxID=3085817 RepID=UPI0039946C30